MAVYALKFEVRFLTISVELPKNILNRIIALL